LSRLRFPLLGLSVLILLLAIWAGWLRLGWPWPTFQPDLALIHGPLMVSGFLGTLVSLERAVALGARWMYLGPFASAAGAVLLLTGTGGSLGPILITLGSLGLVAIFAVIVRRHPVGYTIIMGIGALAWLVGNLLWLSGWLVTQLVLWWAVFLILTIAGERLELGRVLRLPTLVRTAFVVVISLLLVGLLASLLWRDLGTRLSSLGMLALAVWFFRYDVARRTVRTTGLSQYIAACLLAGYAWLAFAGLLGLVYGAMAAGPRYDAYLHAIFLGFVFSMIFGHAPVIFPAIVGRQYRFHPGLYANLALLHASLLVRVIGDLAGVPLLRMWGGLLNGIVLLLFLISTLILLSVSKRP
jgi:hypothetical protein